MALGLRWSFYEKTTSVLRGDFFFFEFDRVMTLYNKMINTFLSTFSVYLKLLFILSMMVLL